MGEEDTGYTFDGGSGVFGRVDVMVYAGREEAGVTSFATIGMAVELMPAPDARAGGRAELRLHRRGAVGEREREQIAVLLANLTSYPWTVGRALGWGELVSFPSDIPTFPGCRRAFLAGPWIQGQLGSIQTSAGAVRILNVIPVSEAERELALAVRPELFFNDLLDTRDVLAPPVTSLA